MVMTSSDNFDSEWRATSESFQPPKVIVARIEYTIIPEQNAITTQLSRHRHRKPCNSTHSLLLINNASAFAANKSNIFGFRLCCVAAGYLDVTSGRQADRSLTCGKRKRCRSATQSTRRRGIMNWRPHFRSPSSSFESNLNCFFSLSLSNVVLRTRRWVSLSLSLWRVCQAHSTTRRCSCATHRDEITSTTEQLPPRPTRIEMKRYILATNPEFRMNRNCCLLMRNAEQLLHIIYDDCTELRVRCVNSIEVDFLGLALLCGINADMLFVCDN